MNSQTLDCKKDLLNCILARRREQWERTQIAKLSMLGKAPKNDSWKTKYEIPLSCDQVQLPPLPGGWTWATIDQIAELVTKGSSPNWQGFQYCQQGIVFVRSQNVDWGSLNLSDIAHLPPSFNDREKKSVLRKGDVLLNIVGASIGRVAIASEELDGGNVNQAVAVIRLVPNGVLNAFLVLYLLSPDAQKRIHAEKVDVARANISLEDIRALPIPLSPLDEQYRIVTEIEKQFTRLDAGVASLKRVQAALKRYRASVLKAACEGRLVITEAELARREGRNYETASERINKTEAPPRPNRWNSRSKDNIPGHAALGVGNPNSNLPEGWAWSALVEIARMESGHTPSRGHPKWWDGDIPWIGIADAREHNGGVIFETFQHTNEDGLANSAARLLPKGSVCISRTASVGYVVVMGRAMATSQDFVNWIPTSAVTSDWLRVVFSADRETLRRFGKGSVHKTIYFPEWLSIHVAVPPLVEQHRIVTEVDRRLSIIEELEAVVGANLNRAERLQQAMLQRAFDGALAN